ncbi:MAG: SoxR reducing system RseC family protein [Bacteroidales bacterium]|nr:SoxR reducing system RseC family protein [Bacteroidales bacterium]
MQKDNSIEHAGIVKSVEDGQVIVNIVSHPACAGCMASGICDLSSQESKEIQTTHYDKVNTGDPVTVVMEQSMGFRALFLGYLIPFLIVLTILITLTSLSVSEPVSGVAAFLSLVPYYLTIYLKKEKIGKSFSFTIKKQIK